MFESERRTGHRNRAIAHLLLNFGLVHEEAERALDVYFRQCAILVTCRDLAMMAATLSNMGRNPVTGVPVFDITSVRHMLAIMFTCGMYDYSGEWAYRVGVPAKSGVSGGVMAVVNRQIGIATYSPRLDARGQQHARHRGVRRTRREVRATRLRLPEFRVEFPKSDALTRPLRSGYCCCCCARSGPPSGAAASRDIHGTNGGASPLMPASAGPTLTPTASSLRTALMPLYTPRVGGTSA